MNTVINSMIDQAVKCVKCGAPYGKCDCWPNLPGRTKWLYNPGDIVTMKAGHKMYIVCHYGYSRFSDKPDEPLYVAVKLNKKNQPDGRALAAARRNFFWYSIGQNTIAGKE